MEARGQVIIYGYSYGVVVDLAHSLNEKEVIVDLLVKQILLQGQQAVALEVIVAVTEAIAEVVTHQVQMEIQIKRSILNLQML